MSLDRIILLLSEIVGIPPEEMDGGTRLTPEYDITAIDIAKLMIEIEKRFKVTIHDEDVHTFQTLQDVADYVDAIE